jgi:hypothetical protein
MYEKVNCYITFLDILGFGEIVEHNTFEYLMKIYQNALLAPLQIAASNGNIQIAQTDDGSRAIADLSNTSVDCMVISDSIILWNTDSKMISFPNLCALIGKFMHGALSCGILTKAFGMHGKNTQNNDVPTKIANSIEFVRFSHGRRRS